MKDRKAQDVNDTFPNDSVHLVPDGGPETTSKEQGDTDQSSYQMTVSLNVLEHLGLNLYSKVPAVLSEAVANAWDADAERVEIDLDTEDQRITITDDGHGMSREDVNERYLYVGYRRREDEDRPNETPQYGRPVMGRKGIGKLSLFSIANIVKVYTTDGNDKNSFQMVVDDMREKMEQETESGDLGQAVYYPDELDHFPDDLEQGTRVVLTGLKKQIQKNLTADYLKRRLARRFGILGEEYSFEMIVNGEPVTFDDRDYFHKLQLLFHYGPGSDQYVERCKNLDRHEERSSTIQIEYGGEPRKFEVKGWIGTVETYSDLQGEDEDLNKISIMMRGKLAQEDILEDTNIGGLFDKYVIGVLHADFFDRDDMADMATSDRERLIKDDPRYEALRNFVEDELDYIDDVWNEHRVDEGEEKAREIGPIDDWFESLSGRNQERARELFGTINQMSVEDQKKKRRIFKHSVLAFESLRYRDDLDRLERISPENVEQLADIFDDLDDIEATLYHQIVSQRVDVIEELQAKVEEGALDEVLQEYLYDHPWLLDPAWERAASADDIEKKARSEFREVDKRLSPEARQGRVDIRYMKTTGQHIIIDLRDANRELSRADLISQLSRYRKALQRVLNEIGRGDEPIEIVSIVGQELEEWETENDVKETDEMLEAINARVLLYDDLLQDAIAAYRRYMEEREEADRIRQLIESIETEEVF